MSLHSLSSPLLFCCCRFISPKVPFIRAHFPAHCRRRRRRRSSLLLPEGRRRRRRSSQKKEKPQLLLSFLAWARAATAATAQKPILGIEGENLGKEEEEAKALLPPSHTTTSLILLASLGEASPRFSTPHALGEEGYEGKDGGGLLRRSLGVSFS